MMNLVIYMYIVEAMSQFSKVATSPLPPDDPCSTNLPERVR
jgi:hypothetical protein